MKQWIRVTRLALIGAIFIGQPVWGQEYPNKPIRMVVPFAPGGAADILARIVADQFVEAWGKPVVIDNRAGAAGNIAAGIVAKAPPDGHTLLMGSMGTQAMNVSLYSKLPFDPARDFAPISMVAKNPNLLAVHPTLPVNTVKELIAYAKARPGKLNYPSSGSGSMAHMTTELFKLMTGVQITHIPYKGGAPAVAAALSGEADLLFIVLPPILPHIKSGRLRPIAMGSRERHPLLPEVPTVIESGLPGFEVRQWYGLLAPAGTPKPVVAKLHAAVHRIVNNPQVHKRIFDTGSDPTSTTPAEFEAVIREDTARWAKVAKATGATAE